MEITRQVVDRSNRLCMFDEIPVEPPGDQVDCDIRSEPIERLHRDSPFRILTIKSCDRIADPFCLLSLSGRTSSIISLAGPAQQLTGIRPRNSLPDLRSEIQRPVLRQLDSGMLERVFGTEQQTFRPKAL